MVERDEVRRAYDEMADIYAAERLDDGEEMQFLEDVVDSLPTDPVVLDAGCGNGQPVLARVSERANVCGVDFSAEQLRRAVEHVSSAAFVQGDMTTLPIAGSSFDAVLAFWSVIHVPAGEHLAVFEEFNRVLRPGGRLLISAGPGTWTGRNENWLDSGVEMAWHLAGADRTREQLETAGFRIDERVAVPDSMAPDRDESETPWTFFAATLTA